MPKILITLKNNNVIEVLTNMRPEVVSDFQVEVVDFSGFNQMEQIDQETALKQLNFVPMRIKKARYIEKARFLGKPRTN